jgi:aspartyl-tRNA(Asn)/glutamyl-tRNA(Gln) amidotransferase subunit C
MDKEKAGKIARLAHLQFDAPSLEKMAGDMNTILGLMEKLAEVNTDDVKPMTSASDNTLFWREDKVTDGHKQADILANAPETTEGFFVVPKVVE